MSQKEPGANAPIESGAASALDEGGDPNLHKRGKRDIKARIKDEFVEFFGKAAVLWVIGLIFLVIFGVLKVTRNLLPTPGENEGSMAGLIDFAVAFITPELFLYIGYAFLLSAVLVGIIRLSTSGMAEILADGIHDGILDSMADPKDDRCGFILRQLDLGLKPSSYRLVAERALSKAYKPNDATSENYIDSLIETYIHDFFENSTQYRKDFHLDYEIEEFSEVADSNWNRDGYVNCIKRVHYDLYRDLNKHGTFKVTADFDCLIDANKLSDILEKTKVLVEVSDHSVRPSGTHEDRFHERIELDLSSERAKNIAEKLKQQGQIEHVPDNYPEGIGFTIRFDQGRFHILFSKEYDTTHSPLRVRINTTGPQKADENFYHLSTLLPVYGIHLKARISSALVAKGWSMDKPILAATRYLPDEVIDGVIDHSSCHAEINLNVWTLPGIATLLSWQYPAKTDPAEQPAVGKKGSNGKSSTEASRSRKPQTRQRK